MKPLFSEEEFKGGSSKQVFKLECIQCNTIFEKSKKAINDSLRTSPILGACFCSPNCVSQYKSKRNKPTNKICKQCNQNEAIFYSKYTTGEFCSKECAHKYSSNINKKQKNYNIKKYWGTENITVKPKRIYPKKNHIYKPKKIKYDKRKRFASCSVAFCLSCGYTIKNKRRQYCKECVQYKNLRKFFLKLGITEKNVIIANQQAVEKFKHLYFDLEKSKIDLEKEYGLNTNSIYLFSKRNNISLRTVGEGVSKAFKNNKIKIINPCSNSFYKQEYHTGHTGQVFFCRSSYEIKLANKLDELKEYYEYENLSIEYNKRGKKAYYLPDFYLPQYNLILEPKSKYFFKHRNDIYKSQFKAVIKQGYKIHYLFDEDIKNLDKINSFEEYLNNLQNTKYF